MLSLTSSSRPRCSAGTPVAAVARGEIADRLLPAVFEDLEIVGGQVGDEAALPVGDRDADVDQIDAARGTRAAGAGARAQRTPGAPTDSTGADRIAERVEARRAPHGPHSTPSAGTRPPRRGV